MPTSPYSLDDRSIQALIEAAVQRLRTRRVFFDGVLKGDYSLAIVNRHLARALINAGVDLTLFTPEEGWQDDPTLGETQDVRERCTACYPLRHSFHIHLRNTWPPRADDMIGEFNAYVCFAWEEGAAPQAMMEHFNAHLDLVMVTANFVERAFRNSGLRVPIEVVGNGTDHISDPGASQAKPKKRIIHVSSCFPRKGADILVDAYCREFDRDEDIELLIKTFDNPHNSIEHIVESARKANPDSAPIRVIKASLPHQEVATLVGGSTLLAAPSRGEGFGLPLAEALVLGVPIVTTNYGGQLDFCNNATAWLVDYSLVPSEGHVSATAAVWAEPNVSSLSKQLRQGITDVRSSRAKVQKGRRLLESHFKWSDVARRVAVAIDRTGSAKVQSNSPQIRIDLVSTWSQVCGVATYSEHLLSADPLRTMLDIVYARGIQNDAIPISHSQPTAEVRRIWGYDYRGVAQLHDA